MNEVRRVVPPDADDNDRRYAGSAVRAGVGFGTALAIAISYTHNKSILWAILHGVLSWLYVIYAAFKY